MLIKDEKIDSFLDRNADMRHLYENFVLKKYTEIEGYFLLRFIFGIDDTLLITDYENTGDYLTLRDHVNSIPGLIIEIASHIRTEMELNYIPPWDKKQNDERKEYFEHKYSSLGQFN